MLSQAVNAFVRPSPKKLALVPAAFAAAALFWWLCRFAEWFPIPGVAEPCRSPHFWWLYASVFFAYMVEVIGTASRKSPHWYLLPAWAAFRCIVYPFSIVVAKLCLPFVTLGLLDSTAAVWAGPLAAFVYRNHFAPSATFDPVSFLRGARRLSEPEKAKAVAEQHVKATALAPASAEPAIRWVGNLLPGSISEGHFGVVATPGGGKTLMQRELMTSVLPHIVPGSDRRAIVYDVKGDLLSYLHQLNIRPELIITLNPFDARSVAWDIARDIDTQQKADQVAASLIPDRPNDHQPFFANAARSVLKEVLVNLIASAPGKWTLRDLVHVTASPSRLKATLSKTKKGREVLEQFRKPEDTFRNFVQELGTAMRPLETVAALWEHAGRRISLREWKDARESILVLDGRQEHRASLVPLNRVIFNFLSSQMVSGPESPKRARFWVFLDEVQDASRLEGLLPLLNLGRSKGIRCVIGFQDIEGLHIAYGRDEGDKLAGLARNMSILKLTSPATAEWASRRLGEYEAIEYRTSWGVSTTVSEQLSRRQAVMPAEFLHLHDPAAGERGQRVSGFHLLLGVHGIVEHTAEHPTYQSVPHIDFAPRPAEQQSLREWDDADATRLGIDATLGRSKQRKSRRKEVNEPERKVRNEKPPEYPAPSENFDSLSDFTAPE